MRNITLAIDEETLRAGREYARAHKTSLNALVRDLLERTVRTGNQSLGNSVLDEMENFTGDSGGHLWKREELHVR